MFLFSEYLAKIELVPNTFGHPPLHPIKLTIISSRVTGEHKTVCIYPRDAMGKASFLNEELLVIIRCVEINRRL